eukprot:475221-Pyramimonas_sp.AAC.1
MEPLKLSPAERRISARTLPLRDRVGVVRTRDAYRKRRRGLRIVRFYDSPSYVSRVVSASSARAQRAPPGIRLAAPVTSDGDSGTLGVRPRAENLAGTGVG